MDIHGVNSGKQVFNQAASVPTMWLSRNGPIQFLVSSIWNWDIGIEYNNAIYIIGKPSNDSGAFCWKYDATNGWVNQTGATPINGAGSTKDTCMVLYADSRGHLYASFTDASAIYQSTTDGATWTNVQALESTAFIKNIAEDSSGNLYAGEYDADAVADGTHVHLWKSSDGTTWTDIAANLPGITTQKHIHDVYYCPHRSTLFVLMGDLNTSDIIYYSTDEGATFTAWAIGQYISITSDADYLYFSAENTSDTGDEQSIYRAANAGDARELVHTLSSSTGASGDGLCWQAMVNDYGLVCFLVASNTCNEALMLVSSDQGDTWYNVYPVKTASDGNTWAVNDRQGFQPRGRVSHYATGSPVNFFYSSGKQWRCYPARQEITINESTGGDYLFTKQSAGDWNTIPDGGGINNNMRVKLEADYSADYTPGTDGVIVDTNGNSFTGDESAQTLVADEGFEGVTADTAASGSSTPTLTGFTYSAQVFGDITPGSTALPYAGSQSCRIINTGTYSGVRKGGAFNAAAAGDIVGISGMIHVVSAGWNGANDVSLMADGGNIVKLKTDGVLAVISEDSAIGELRQTNNDYPFVFDQYINLKLMTYVHGTLGWIKLWQDGVLIIEVYGLDTDTGTSYGNADWQNGGQVVDGLTVYWDDIKASLGTAASGSFDPDKPVSPVLNGSSQAILPNGIYS